MWSVGCIFAELATGSPFFEGSSEIEQLFRIFSITGVPQKELMQIISPGLKSSFTQLLAIKIFRSK
jgi:hypothetical protein